MNITLTKIKTTVAIGDVVLRHDHVPCNQWKIGVVTDLHKGKDGLVRSVSLRVSSGTELLRPIEKLYPLEVSSEHNAQSTEKEDKEAIANEPPPVHKIHDDTILKYLSFTSHSILFLI